MQLQWGCLQGWHCPKGQAETRQRGHYYRVILRAAKYVMKGKYAKLNFVDPVLQGTGASLLAGLCYPLPDNCWEPEAWLLERDGKGLRKTAVDHTCALNHFHYWWEPGASEPEKLLAAQHAKWAWAPTNMKVIGSRANSSKGKKPVGPYKTGNEQREVKACVLSTMLQQALQDALLMLMSCRPSWPQMGMAPCQRTTPCGAIPDLSCGGERLGQSTISG